MQDSQETVKENIASTLLRGDVSGLLLAVSGIAFGLRAPDLGIFLLIPGVYIGIAALIQKKRLRPTAPDRADFTIPRIQRVNEALGMLKTCKNGILVLSGNSGVGKSKLAKAMAKELAADGFSIIEERNYGPIWIDEFNQKIPTISREERVLIILDQFEKVFIASSNIVLEHVSQLHNLFAACRNSSAWRCLVVVRREWFLNLMIFEELRPSLGDVLLLGGFDPSYEKNAYEMFRRRLVHELANDELLADAVIEDTRRLWRDDLLYTLRREENGTISQQYLEDQVVPVEALAVVDALRYMREKCGQEISLVWYQRAGGLREAMRVFFEAFVRASGYPDDASRLLAALSVEPRARRPLTDSDLSWITNMPLYLVQRLVKYFAEKQLLEWIDHRIDWVHDFFAERFNELSGNFLDPAERDNIAFFWERLAGNASDQGLDGIRKNAWERKFSYLLFGLSAALLVTRLLMYSIVSRVTTGSSQWVWPEALHPIGFVHLSTVDISFLPIAISLTGWSWYTTSLFRKLFSRLDEGRIGIFFSWFVSILSTVLVGLSVVFPKLWILFMGVGGLGVGLKFFSVGIQMGRRWRRLELFFGSAGLATCFNCLICIVVGAGYAWFLRDYGGDPLGTIRFAVGLGAMAVMVYFAYVVSSLHINGSRALLILGIYRRYRRAPRSSELDYE